MIKQKLPRKKKKKQRKRLITGIKKLGFNVDLYFDRYRGWTILKRV